MQKVWLSLLFVLVFLVSIVYHLPASWGIKQLKEQEILPTNVQLAHAEGYWWKGKARIQYKAEGGFSQLGTVSWQLQWFSLLMGEIASNSTWRFKQSRLDGFIKSSGKIVKIEGLTGEINLPNLAELLPQVIVLSDAAGNIHFREVSGSLSLETNSVWPTQLAGQLALTDFALYGAEIPLIEASPKVVKKQLLMDLTGKGQQWHLKGKVVLPTPQSYQVQVDLIADNEKSMPEWALLTMRKRAPTVAQLIQQGRW